MHQYYSIVYYYFVDVQEYSQNIIHNISLEHVTACMSIITHVTLSCKLWGWKCLRVYMGVCVCVREREKGGGRELVVLGSLYYGIPMLTKLSMLNTIICAKFLQIYGQTLYVFNYANALSNRMSMYGQTVQYIWSKFSYKYNIMGKLFLCVQPCKYILSNGIPMYGQTVQQIHGQISKTIMKCKIIHNNLYITSNKYIIIMCWK